MRAIPESVFQTLKLALTEYSGSGRAEAFRWLESRPIDGLTDRELEVVKLAAKGLSNDQIADSLGIKNRTVRSHLFNVYLKLSFSNRAQLTLWAIRHGAIDIDEGFE